MTREELLKSYILKQYRTVKDFSVAIGLLIQPLTVSFAVV